MHQQLSHKIHVQRIYIYIYVHTGMKAEISCHFLVDDHKVPKKKLVAELQDGVASVLATLGVGGHLIRSTKTPIHLSSVS